jgi:CMP-N-acetylneuraminic acid synthetase
MLNSKKIVALLPMKANSERVRGKNFKNFDGKPLFKWILDTLLAIEFIDLIVINTDAKDILEQNGLIKNDRIIIRDRKKELCGDMVSMNLVLADDIENVDADLYLMTHTTNPFLSKNTIIDALYMFEIALTNRTADSLFTVSKTQTRFYRSDGSAVNHDPENLVRTQDLEEWFEENSNLYIFTKNSFKSTNARIGLKPILYPTNKFESIDIDNQEDWDFANIAAKFLKRDN